MARITMRVQSSDNFDAPADTQYLALANQWTGTNGTEANVQQIERQPCQFKHLSLDINSNAANGNSVYTFRLNGANGNQTITVPAASTGKFQDLINTDTVVAGDLTCLKIDTTGSASGNVFRRSAIAAIYPGTISGLKYFEPTATTIAANTTFFYCLNIVTSATETTAQLNINNGNGQWRGLLARVITNTVTAASTFTSRKNTAAGNQTVTIPSSTTGTFEDTTNTDSIASGDDICYRMVTGATGTSLIFRYGSELGFNDGKVMMVSTNALSRNTNVTHFIPPAGGNEIVETVETWVRSIAPYQFRASKLQLRVFNNTCSTTITFRFRNNNSNGNQVLTVATTLTGYFEDASNTDLVEQGSEYCYSASIPTGTGATILLHRSVLVDAGQIHLQSFTPNNMRPRAFAPGLAR